MPAFTDWLVCHSSARASFEAVEIAAEWPCVRFGTPQGSSEDTLLHSPKQQVNEQNNNQKRERSQSQIGQKSTTNQTKLAPKSVLQAVLRPLGGLLGPSWPQEGPKSQQDLQRGPIWEPFWPPSWQAEGPKSIEKTMVFFHIFGFVAILPTRCHMIDLVSPKNQKC